MQQAISAIARSKAARLCERHIAAAMFSVAKRILAAASKYSHNSRITNEGAFNDEARRIAIGAVDSTEAFISDYALASTKYYGIEGSGIMSFLTSAFHGATSRERTTKYMANFAEDIVRMVKAGVLLGYPSSKILSAIRTGYKDPYHTSIITKARKYDINIATPSYGQGIFHSAYQNIARNARQMIAVAWGMAERQYGEEHGAIGFTSHRGSSFPCPICDDETTYRHKMTDPFPPYHINCVCWVRFIYNDNEN